MVLVIDKRTVHVQVPDSPVISFSSSKNFSLQIWYSCEAVFTCVRVLTVSEVLTGQLVMGRVNPETWSDVPGWQREPGWPALLAKTRSWTDGFGIYGGNDR